MTTVVHNPEHELGPQVGSITGTASSDWFWATLFSAVVMGWALFNGAMQSWIALPIFACGVLTSVDAVAWIRRRVDLYDPIGVIGVLGIHFFFLAPILHIVWNTWSAYVTPLQDWSDWLGWMAVINAAGLVLYRFVRSMACPPDVPIAEKVRVPGNALWPLLIVGLAVSGVAQLVVYWSFGGIEGYIYAFSHVKTAFVGWGWVFTISESFPILFMLAFAAYYLRRGVQPSWPVVIGVLIAFFVMKLAFGGLRGSRSNTVWGVVWAVGIIHLLVRRIPRVVVMIGLGFMLVFMYVYGFYKADGLRGLQSALDPTSRSHLQRDTGRTFNMVLLGDLARADIQAYLLRQTCSSQSHYQWAWGRTYLGSATLLIPKSVRGEVGGYITRYGTNALFGEGFAGEASNVYGLAGEAMLNFGPAAALLSFALFGYLVGRFRRFLMALRPLDLRWALVPFGIYMCVAVLVGDSDNVVYAFIKEGAIPLIVVYGGSYVLRLWDPQAAQTYGAGAGGYEYGTA